ncbi:MAG: putative zinc-binding peptidase [Planctomycetota bacterium]|nr:putative zinc-binding peptidase [Planctomycetota bacterium]
MRTFHCDHCGKSVFFENTSCGSCGHKLAYVADLKLVVSLDQAGTAGDAVPLWTSPVRRAQGKTYRLCENYTKHNVCNWAVPAEDPNPLCRSCRLTRVIPDLGPIANRDAWCRLEIAKRRLVYSLIEYHLPLRDKAQDPSAGLAFQFMGDNKDGSKVLTGHDNGVITVNIAEADDVERERRRVNMHEPYRTLLGHFRHEIGHYYWDLLLKNAPRVEDYRKLFGDERADYDQALKTHYATGPKPNWKQQFISEYASVHPWEDWAETWAHYLHMTDTLETAAACGLSLRPDRNDEPVMDKQPIKPAHQQSFDEIIDNWYPLTYILNNLNRGMGLPDAYPFILPPPAVDKLRFVHETICQTAKARALPIHL